MRALQKPIRHNTHHLAWNIGAPHRRFDIEIRIRLHNFHITLLRRTLPILIKLLNTKGWTIRKVMWGGGGDFNLYEYFLQFFACDDNFLKI